MNIVKRHLRDTRPSRRLARHKGGIIATEAPIHASNVQLLVKNATARRS